MTLDGQLGTDNVFTRNAPGPEVQVLRFAQDDKAALRYAQDDSRGGGIVAASPQHVDKASDQ